MTDLRTAAEPKTDQLNYDSFLGGATLTIKVTDVTVALTGEQRVVVHYEGENGRPYKPCKSMIRVLIGAWGNDGREYVGRSMTLYGDPKVVFGGQTVGGIRISHMSHIDAPITMALTATRASRKPFTVKPLKVGAAAADTSKEPTGWRSQLWAKVQAAGFTQERFASEFGSLKLLPYDRCREVEAWIARPVAQAEDEPTGDLFGGPKTCDICDTIVRDDGTCPECQP